MLAFVSGLYLQGGFFIYFCSLGLWFQGVVFQDDICRVSCFRTVFAGCCFSGRYLQLHMIVMSWLDEFLGCLALVIFILGNGGIDVTAFNVAPFRNLTCDKILSLLGTFRHAFGGFFLIFCKLNPVWTCGATCAVLFHFPAHLLFFTSTISNFF